MHEPVIEHKVVRRFCTLQLYDHSEYKEPSPFRGLPCRSLLTNLRRFELHYTRSATEKACEAGAHLLSQALQEADRQAGALKDHIEPGSVCRRGAAMQNLGCQFKSNKHSCTCRQLPSSACSKNWRGCAGL